MHRIDRLVLVLLCVSAGCSKGDSNRTSKESELPVSKSPATTWVTEPTKADESIDFVLAWNKWGMDQCSPNENIVLKFLEFADSTVFKSVGTQEVLQIFEKSADEITRRPLLSVSDVSSEELMRYRKRLWRSDDNPHLADCLRENKNVFESVHSLESKESYFLPAVATMHTEPRGSAKHFVFADLSLLVEMGHIVDWLAVRAAWNFGERRPSVGAQDLLTIHHIVRTVNEHGNPLEISIARNWESAALEVERALLLDRRLSSEDKQGIATFRRQWKPPLPSAVAIVNYTRLSTLGVYCELARKDPIAIEMILNQYSEEKFFVGQVWSSITVDDWDLGARLIVAQFDQLELALAQSEFAERKRRVVLWENELAGFGREFREKVRFLKSSGLSPSELDSEDFAKLILGITVPSLPMLLDVLEQSTKDHAELSASWAIIDL